MELSKDLVKQFAGLMNTPETKKDTPYLFGTAIVNESGINVKIDGDRLALGTNLFSDKDTIMEEMGYEGYMNQINRFSNFYYKNIDMR